jgi:hypothetical protein
MRIFFVKNTDYTIFNTVQISVAKGTYILAEAKNVLLPLFSWLARGEWIRVVTTH